MLRVSKGVAAAIAASALLVARTAAAQTATTTTTKSSTTTSSTTTTSTTLLPHPFSKATRSCVKQARSRFHCRFGIACSTDFQTAYANCFAAPAGVSCTKKCQSRAVTCLGAAPATRKTCDKACRLTRRRDVRACERIADGNELWAGGDGTCLASADASFLLCKFVCAEARRDCHTNFDFCIADCPNQ